MLKVLNSNGPEWGRCDVGHQDLTQSKSTAP